MTCECITCAAIAGSYLSNKEGQIVQSIFTFQLKATLLPIPLRVNVRKFKEDRLNETSVSCMHVLVRG